MKQFRFAQTFDESAGSLRAVIIIALLVSLQSPCLSQILSKPEFSFEKLSWGDSLASVKKHLEGRTLMEQDAKEQFGAASAAMPPSILLSYEDSLFNNSFRIVFWFSKHEDQLNSVIIALIRPKSGEVKDEDAVFSDVWEKLSEHYGPSQVDGSIPLVGKTRMWSFKGTDVLMSSVNGLGRKSLTVTYSKNNKQ